MVRPAAASVLAVGLLAAAGCVTGLDSDDEARYARLHQFEEAGIERSLEARIDLGVGRLEVEAGDPGRAYELDLRYDEETFRPEVDFRRDGDQARLNFDLHGKAVRLSGLSRTRLNLRLNPETVLHLKSRTGVSEGRLDMTGLQLGSMELECGVGETELGMLQPNPTSCDRLEISSGVGALEVIGLGNFGFREFRLQAGVGDTTLDFSGDWHRIGDVRLDLGLGRLAMRMPRDVAAEVTVKGSVMTPLDLPGFDKRGNTYYSRNRDRTAKVIKIRVSAGAGPIELEWM